jgi:NAD(P)-dependent dehydrogenase (short-subunit alcohol dehydrogenase family)
MEEQPMGDRLDGRVAVVTGGASGIGEAAVRRFVEEGARVVVADVQVDRGEAVAAAIGDAARFVRCDVTNEDAVADAIRFAVDTWGRLDVMFNNAGVVGAIGPIAETDTDAWLRTIDILVHSVFYGCKHAARAMVAQGFGSIINTSSAAGVMGGLGPHAYTTAKTAVIGLTKSVASELGPKGVRCNAIAPGTIPTPLTAVVTTGDASDLDAVAKSTLERYGRAGDALDIANAALYLASDEAAFVNGHTLVVDYGRTINGGSPRFASAAPKLMGIAGTDEQ